MHLGMKIQPILNPSKLCLAVCEKMRPNAKLRVNFLYFTPAPTENLAVNQSGSTD